MDPFLEACLEVDELTPGSPMLAPDKTRLLLALLDMSRADHLVRRATMVGESILALPQVVIIRCYPIPADLDRGVLLRSRFDGAFDQVAVFDYATPATPIVTFSDLMPPLAYPKWGTLTLTLSPEMKPVIGAYRRARAAGEAR